MTSPDRASLGFRATGRGWGSGYIAVSLAWITDLDVAGLEIEWPYILTGLVLSNHDGSGSGVELGGSLLAWRYWQAGGGHNRAKGAIFSYEL